MASSTPPNYSLTSSRPRSATHSTAHTHLHNHKAPSSALTGGGHCTASLSAVPAFVYPSSTSAAHQNSVLDPVVQFRSQPLQWPRWQCGGTAGLSPDFRRSRTTRVISKRNLPSPRLPTARSAGSGAASRCLEQVLRANLIDGAAIASTLARFRSSLAVPEDYCHILRELGDRDRCAPRALEFFYAALPLVGSGEVEKGKLLTAAIGALGKMARPDLAQKVFDSGIAGGYGNTVFAHSALISAYARSGLATEATGVLESMKGAGLRPTIVSYNAVIDACGKGGVDIQVTLGYYRAMLHDGLHPDRKTFNSLLAACSRAGHLDDARAVFDEMIHLGIARDIYTYNTFIDAICKCGSMDLAVQIASDMEANNVSPNVVTYSTLMDGYSKLEQYDEALKVYEKMKRLRIRLDRICYNTLLAIYVKTGKYNEITRICHEMEVAGVDKDVVTYNSLINGYGKQGRFDMVAYLVEEMRRRRILPSVLTYSTLIDIYSKAGMHVDAANVFLEFKESGLKADVVLFSSFIDTLAKNGMIGSAMWLLDEMTRMGIKPNVVTYNTIIDAFGKSGASSKEEDDVVGLCAGQVVRAAGHGYRGASWSTAEVARSEELLWIRELFQKMLQQGVMPNVVTFSSILNACSRCNSFEDASVLLKQLRLFDGMSRGPGDNSVYGVTHGLLMGCRNVWGQAQSLFDALAARGDPPTSSAFYNALTDMLWHFGQRQGAQRVVIEGVNRRVWENAWGEFSLDLHLMSSGAAQAIVYYWFLKVRSILFEGRALPEFLSILTGWGRHSKIAGSSTLHRVIEALLQAIGAPFELERCNLNGVERFNPGKFVSRGNKMASWLMDYSTINTLMLRDERPPSPPCTVALIPRLQALQL